jgi:nucleoside-diphosphate-sugar epimerase
MIYGPFGKGNLNLLFSIVEKRIPYPLGLYNNQRSYLSIDNLCFVIVETIQNDIAEGIYQLADDATLSTKEVVRLISESIGFKPIIWNVPKIIVSAIAKGCDFLRLPFNTHALSKLTESYCISNDKIISAIGKPLPVSLKEGFLSAFNSLEKSRRIKKY